MGRRNTEAIRDTFVFTECVINFAANQFSPGVNAVIQKIITTPVRGLTGLLICLGAVPEAIAEDDTLKLALRPTLTFDIAHKIALTCIERQKKDGGSPVYIAIYDDAANLILFHKMDGATVGSDHTAMRKAESAARFRVPTREIAGWVKGSPGVGHIPGLLGVTGGLPIFSNKGVHLGGVGVSGAPSDEDESCAQAGIDAVQRYLD